MFGYHRYDICDHYLEIIDSDEDSWSVLDYGCGVAEPAVYLGSLGFEATIVDLDTKLLDFASWRLKQRDIESKCVSANQTERPVNLPQDDYDFIVMSELLEDVRNPKYFFGASH